MNATAKTIVLDAPRYKDSPGINEKTTVSKTILRMKTRHGGNVRLMISYCPADGLCRREYQGPILPGPYAATFPLVSCLDKRGTQGREIKQNMEDGLEYEVQDGDILEMDGMLWQIRDDRALNYPHLYPIN